MQTDKVTFVILLLAPLWFCSFRSLPEKTNVTLEPCPLTTSEPSPSPDINRQPSGSSTSVPPSEPRKSRVRERRREGRSKTFDWSEFKMEPNEKPVRERSETVDLSSSLSTASSYCSPSSSPSSLASSPVSASSIQASCLSGAPPPVLEDAEKENAWRSIPPQSTTSTSHRPSNVTVTMTSTRNFAALASSECPEQGKMEVDHPAVLHPCSHDQKDAGSSDVQEEIEQRWHQVETTPLREKKQVPINTTLGTSDRLPAHELAALLDKEVGFYNVAIPCPFWRSAYLWKEFAKHSNYEFQEIKIKN